MQRCLHTSYNGQPSSANIAIDVLMPPLARKRGESRISIVPPPTSENTARDPGNALIIPKTTNEGTYRSKNLQLKPRRTSSCVVLRELSEKIKFEGDVVEQRSPHCVPYAQYDADKAFKAAVVKKNRKNTGPARPPFAGRVPRVCRLKDFGGGEGPVPVRKANSDTVLLGCHSESLISLKALSPRRNEDMQTKVSAIKGADIPAPTWEEYVISKLSKGTAEVLLPTLHPQKQHKSPPKPSTISFTRNSNDKKEEERGNQEDSTDKKPSPTKVVDDSVDYFKDIPYKPDKSRRVKNVQETFPCSPSKWLDDDGGVDGEVYTYSADSKVTRGMRKWIEYPTYQKEEELLHSEASDVDVTGQGKEHPEIFRRKRFDSPLLPIVKEWREKNLIYHKQVEMSVQGLLTGMDDPDDDVRAAAVSAIAMVISDDSPDEQDEETLILKAEQLVQNDCSFVAVVAAVSLFVVNKVTDEALQMLLKTVEENEDETMCWIALQCLVEQHYHDNCIVKQLLNNLLLYESNTTRHRSCLYMLSKIGPLDMSIQYMVGEKLNSNCWKERVVACRVLPIVNTPLTKDIANKLAHLLWNDWNAEVRKAATEALGKTGNGKIIHNLLREQLQTGDRSKKVGALKKIGNVGIMTAHLLTPLLLCLNSQDDEICIQTIKLCAKMKLNDPSVLEILLELLKSDRACKVRRYVLRALGTIGQKSEDIRSSLLWTLHYNKEPVLRKEACSTLVQLNCHDDEIVGTLQDLVLGDRSEMVRDEVVGALSSMGVAAVGNVELVERIQQNVKELCSKENVIARVVHGTAVEDGTNGSGSSRRHSLSRGSVG